MQLTKYFVQNGDTLEFYPVTKAVFEDETRWSPNWVNNTIVARKADSDPLSPWHFDLAFGNVTADVLHRAYELAQRIVAP